MPALIQIILTRAIIFVTTFFAFVGINPNISAPTPDALERAQIHQQDLVDKVLDNSPTLTVSDTQKGSQTIEQKITQIQKQFTETITQPIKTKVVEKVVPAETISQNTPPSFDVKDAVVNIMCLEKTGTYTKMSSGSGVVISASGLVLTNAHVAYPFLLSSQFGFGTYTCTIRKENIPNYGYNAELVYYPLDWLSYNSEIIKDPSPVGTGENDYAVLAITTPTGPVPKNNPFVHASIFIDDADLKTSLPVVAAGYPSSNSGVFSVDTNPGLKIADTKIDDFYTFSKRSFDVLQTGINPVARRGSSGGGIFKDDALYGIVVTTNDKGEGSYINALTIPYIKRDFENDTGIDFESFVNSPLDILKLRFSTSYKENLKNIISESLD